MSDDPVARVLKSLSGTLREFTLTELRKATDNYKKMIAKAGFADVYRGVRGVEGGGCGQGGSGGSHTEDDFLEELTIVNRLRHKHLVPLVGESLIPSSQ